MFDISYQLAAITTWSQALLALAEVRIQFADYVPNQDILFCVACTDKDRDAPRMQRSEH